MKRRKFFEHMLNAFSVFLSYETHTNTDGRHAKRHGLFTPLVMGGISTPTSAKFILGSRFGSQLAHFVIGVPHKFRLRTHTYTHSASR
jgi:hypothetical protein